MGEIIFQHTQLNYDSSTRIDIGLKGSVCRFCKPADASFKNASHSIPEFLGNKSIFTVDECDACNKLFGEGIESDLSKFIPPSWLTRIEGKKGYKKTQITKGVSLFSDKKFIDINFDHKYEDVKKHLKLENKGSKFSSLNVYKAFVKILISLIPNEYLDEFDELIAWLRSGSGFDSINHKPFVIVGHQHPDYRMPDVMKIEIIRQSFGDNVVYQLDCRFNNFYVKLPLSPRAKCYFRIGSVIPAEGEIHKIHFQEIDFSNYVVKHNYKINLKIPTINGGKGNALSNHELFKCAKNQ